MIDYTPFWETLKQSKENWYTLTMKHNQDISMKTVNDLCRILDCEIDGIARYVPSDKDQAL